MKMIQLHNPKTVRYAFQLLFLLVPIFSFANLPIFSSGFEKTLSEEWSNASGNNMAVFERNATAKYQGEFGMQMKFNASNQKGNLFTPKNINWVQGETYHISFWYKAIDPSDNATSNIKLHLEDGTKIGQLQITNWANSDWTKYESDYKCTDNGLGYALFSIRPNSSGGGEYYFDDFEIVKIEIEEDYWGALKSKKVLSDTTVKWVQFGPGMSGNNKCAFWHPTDEHALYIGPNMGNAYVSFDKGYTYQTIFDEDESSYKVGERGPVEFFSIDFSRQDPDFGMCSDERNNGIFKTNDRGVTWQNMGISAMDGKYVSCVAVDPQNDNIWYAGGGEMRNLGRMLFPNSQPHGTYVNDGSLKKLWKSTDKGRTWTLRNNGLHEKAQFETIIVDPKNSNIIYATTNYGFYKSTDGADTWVQKTNGFDYDVMRAMTHHYDAENDVLTLFVICNPMWKADGQTITDDKGGIFKSTDRGETWVKINGNIALDMTQWQNNADIKKSYSHCAAYVFGMTDADFLAAYPNMPSKITQRFNTIAVDPNDVNNLYMNNEYSNASRNNFKPGQVWRSTDGGQNWHVALRNGKAWKEGSSDYQYWTDRNNPMETNIHLRYLDEWVDRDFYERKGCNFVRWNADGTVLHTQMAKISLFSFDKGVTWLDIDDEFTAAGNIVGAGNSNVPGHGFFQHPDIKNKVFCAAGENQLAITTTDGEEVRNGAQAIKHVRIQSAEASLSCYAIHPHDTLQHFALFFRQAKKGKLLKSNDGGKTWFEQGTAIPSWDTNANSGDQSVHQISLIIDPTNPDNMYFVVPQKSRNIEYVGNSVTAWGVHKSTDGGKTWKESNAGLPDSKDATTIAFDPENSSTLYVSIQNGDGGLFRSTDKGENWSEVLSTKSISGSQGINDIHFARNGKAYITAGAGWGGINDGGAWVSEDGLNTWKRIFDYPWTFRIETAYYNPNTILVSTLPSSKVDYLNPGIFVSQDGGETWTKINKGNGQSDRINDIAIDNHNPGKLYVSTYGSSWYTATLPHPNTPIAVEHFTLTQTNLTIDEDQDSLLSPVFTPSYAYNQEITWKSDNDDIAKVNGDGLLTGINKGNTVIRATSKDGGFEATVNVKVIGNVGVHDVEKKSLSVYPNPANTEINISALNAETEMKPIHIYSLMGEHVMDFVPNKTNPTVSVRHLPDGMYVIKMSTDQSIYTARFVKN